MRLFFTLALVVLLSSCALTPVDTAHQGHTGQQGYPTASTDQTIRERMAAAERALSEARLTDAEIAYRELTESHPRLPDVWLHLGNVYARQSQLEAAIRVYNEGLVHRPADGRLWNNLAVVQLKQAIHTLEKSTRVLPAGDPYRARALSFHDALLTAGAAEQPVRTSPRNSTLSKTQRPPELRRRTVVGASSRQPPPAQQTAKAQCWELPQGCR